MFTGPHLQVALDQLFDALEAAEDKDAYVGTPGSGKGHMMRCDFEYDANNTKDAAEAFKEAMYLDLSEIIELGDTTKTTEVGIRNIDGARKRGRYPSAVTIPGAKVTREFHFQKDTIEYTMYFRLLVEW